MMPPARPGTINPVHLRLAVGAAMFNWPWPTTGLIEINAASQIPSNRSAQVSKES